MFDGRPSNGNTEDNKPPENDAFSSAKTDPFGSSSTESNNDPFTASFANFPEPSKQKHSKVYPVLCPVKSLADSSIDFMIWIWKITTRRTEKCVYLPEQVSQNFLTRQCKTSEIWNIWNKLIKLLVFLKGTKAEKDMIEWAKRQSRKDEKDRQKKLKCLQDEEDKQIALAVKKSLEESNA